MLELTEAFYYEKPVDYIAHMVNLVYAYTRSNFPGYVCVVSCKMTCFLTMTKSIEHELLNM